MKKIRFAQLSDAEELLRIYAPYVTDSVITFEYDVPSPIEFEKRMMDIQREYPYLVCEIDGNIAGYAYAHRHKERAAYGWNVELSIYLDHSYVGRGIGRALYTVLLKILQLQHVVNAYACITLPNEASMALHTSFGFTPVGVFSHTGYKFGKWLDVIWLEKALQDMEEEPKPLCSIELLDYIEIMQIFQYGEMMIREEL